MQEKRVVHDGCTSEYDDRQAPPWLHQPARSRQVRGRAHSFRWVGRDQIRPRILDTERQCKPKMTIFRRVTVEKAGCGRRVAILHAGKVFACRQCRNLVYGSQRESESPPTPAGCAAGLRLDIKAIRQVRLKMMRKVLGRDGLEFAGNFCKIPEKFPEMRNIHASSPIISARSFS